MGYSEGLDAEIMGEEQKEENKIVPIDEAKPKRRQFFVWTVGENDYNLKLNANMIGALEKKYNTNVLNLVSSDGLPPLTVMLTIIQAAMSPWNHETDYSRVKKLYDKWCNDGGNQIELLSKVIMPTLVVSGFFTQKQGEQIMEELEAEDELT